jgi:hypothetical protein
MNTDQIINKIRYFTIRLQPIERDAGHGEGGDAIFKIEGDVDDFWITKSAKETNEKVCFDWRREKKY